MGRLRRYRALVELGALEIDVTVLPPARRRALEALGRRMTAQQIRRLEPARRHPLLLECVATGELPFDRLRNEIGLDRLRAAAAVDPGQVPPIDVQQLDQLRSSYSHLRPAMHAVLDAVQLRGAASTDDELLAMLQRVRAATGQVVAEPVELVPKAWRAWVQDPDGRVRRTRLELGLWFVLRDALRAGRVLRPIGRRYADPAGFLMPVERWEADRSELAITFGRTLDADQRLQELEAE